jgi:hypothetical protein
VYPLAVLEISTLALLISSGDTVLSPCRDGRCPGLEVMSSMALGTDLPLTRRQGCLAGGGFSRTGVALPAQPVDVFTGKDLVRLDLVVFIGQVSLARTVAVRAGDILPEMSTLEVFGLHVDMALLAPGQGILRSRRFCARRFLGRRLGVHDHRLGVRIPGLFTPNRIGLERSHT